MIGLFIVKLISVALILLDIFKSYTTKWERKSQLIFNKETKELKKPPKRVSIKKSRRKLVGSGSSANAQIS